MIKAGRTAAPVEVPAGTETLEIIDWMWATSPTPYDLSDDNWDRGVSKDGTNFFVGAAEPNLTRFENARSVA